MRESGKRLASLFEKLPSVIVANISTLDIDAWIARELVHLNMISQSKGYHGYKHVSCISVNHEIVHGVPSEHKRVSLGDMVKVDVCAAWNGYCADMARCFFVGAPTPEAIQLVQGVQSSLDAACAVAVVGGRLSDISAAIETTARDNGLFVVREFCGHGIGRRMHEDPEIPNFGQPGKGPVLMAGMTFAIEPMATLVKTGVVIEADRWTASTENGCWAAHIEDTVIVTESGPEIVTRME